MASNHHINPRFRAYGKARIDITRRAQSEIEWQRMWREPLHPFPFEFPGSLKFGIEYTVNDFAAEIGFYIDVLGFPVIAFSPSYAQFTTPEEGFSISVAAVIETEKSTNPETIRLQFYVEDILETAHMLEQRGIVFEQKPAPSNTEPDQLVSKFRTPHGVQVYLVGEMQQKPDIHSLMDKNEEDEAEADRIIQQLLNLSSSDAAQDIDLFDEEEMDQGENFSKMDEHRSGQLSWDDEQEPPAKNTLPSKDTSALNQQPKKTGTSIPLKANGSLVIPDSREAPNGSEDSQRNNGELTYHEIEDDSLEEDLF